jgi:hypothetical protein
MIERRQFLLGFAVLAAPGAVIHNDKRTLLALFDRVGIDVSDPSVDKTPNSLSISVDGDNVTGTDGGMVVFKFDAKGILTEVVVWNGRMENSSTPE